MNIFRRLFFKTPAAPSVPFHYRPGPVFTEPAMAAIYVSDLSKPPQRILGGGYPVAMQIRSLQDAELYAQPAVTLQGLGGQQAGQYALAPLTNDDGTWPSGADINPVTD